MSDLDNKDVWEKMDFDAAMSLERSQIIQQQEVRILELEAVYSAAVGRIVKAKAILERALKSHDAPKWIPIEHALAALEGKEE